MVNIGKLIIKVRLKVIVIGGKMTTSDARIMALTMYNVDCIKTFNDWKDKDIKELVQEISELSLRAPIYETNFDKGFWKKVTKDMNLKHLECGSDNEFRIKGIYKKYTPLFLMAVVEYGANRLSGNQIENMEGFGHLKNARILSRQKKVKKRKR